MPHWIGSFDKSGSPILRVSVSGPFTEGVEFDAVLDTGFSGFLSLPLIQAIKLGLVLHGTTFVTLADGSQSFKLTAKGMVAIKGESQIGVAILEPSSTEILLGMGFLRLFNRALYVSHDAIIVTDLAAMATTSEADEQPPPPLDPPPVDSATA